jgi:hypothetical protein
MPPNKTLTPGTTSADVTALQKFLMGKGFQIPAGATGYYGDQTKAAVSAWQKANGVQTQGNDGYWGPISIATASKPASVVNQTQNKTPAATYSQGQNIQGGQVKFDTLTGKPLQPGQTTSINPTAAEVEAARAAEEIKRKQAEIDAKTNSHPDLAETVKKYGTWEDALNASGGDVTKMTDMYGTPFSQTDQTQAMSDASAALDPYYQAETQKDTQDAEASMAKSQADYQNYLQTSGQNFQADKTKQDQNAADQGVLFSGGRIQKQQNLQNAYSTDNASKLADLTASVGNAARDYQYKYGNNNANNLSKYYSAGKNTYNAGVATGGVGNSGMSSIYNTGSSNFQGTNINAAKAAKEQRAAGLLWNKGNKLVSSGLNNQYK